MQAVVPVKSFKNAKKRLASVLTEGQRCTLMKHMLDDVLTAIASVSELEAITLVSNDAEVLAWVAKRAPGMPLPLRVFDPCPRQGGSGPVNTTTANDQSLTGFNTFAESGLCHAYSTVAAELSGRGLGTMLFLPADLPLVTKADIDALLTGHGSPGVSVAAAGSDGGTNALLVSPPDIIAPAFGENSCQHHITRARERGVLPLVLNNLGLGLDIDTVEDIQLLLAADRECATLRYLRESGIAAELENNAEGGHLQNTKAQQHCLHNQTNRQVG